MSKLERLLIVPERVLREGAHTTQGPDSGKPATHRQAAVVLYNTAACPIAGSTAGAASGCVAKSPLSFDSFKGTRSKDWS